MKTLEKVNYVIIGFIGLFHAMTANGYISEMMYEAVRWIY